MSARRFLAYLSISIITFFCLFTAPVNAQLPFLPKINLEMLNQNSGETLISSCVRLDGICIFQISDKKSNLSQRIQFTEERLKDIGQSYFKTDNSQLAVYNQTQGYLQTIYVSVERRELPVLTLSNQDAARKGVLLEHEAERIAAQIKKGLQKAKRQRQIPHLMRQGKIAVIIAIATIVSYLLNYRLLIRTQKLKEKLYAESPKIKNFALELKQRRKINFQSIKYRLLQFMQIVIGAGGIILILGLFPYTLTTQLWIITFIRIPLRIFLVCLATYILIRLNYALINRLNTFLNSERIDNNYVFSPETNRRLRIRINTISHLLRGIVTCFWIGVGIIFALAIVGINITPILAGAGILGLAFSFASQSLIQDTLNGFFIILEDQYAVGDVVTIGEVGGLVENLNLRITQLRDADGSLITLANSQINNVANHSNGWSRSDLKIPVAYDADIDQAIAIVNQIATEVCEDPDWQTKVIEPPEILGVEDFAEYGMVIRLWFKTEPLKQWEVAREFRRRVKIAFSYVGISLATTQQQIWLHNTKL